LLAEASGDGDRVKKLDIRASAFAIAAEQLMLWLPNIPAADSPVGDDASKNVTVREGAGARGEPASPKAHWDLFENEHGAGLLDTARGAKIAGSGFPVLRGALARLERALTNYFLDTHTRSHGYTEVNVPILVNDRAMLGTGQLPKSANDMYRVAALKDLIALGEGDEPEAGLWLIPTAEVPITNLYNDEILGHKELPIQLTGLTPCFRREAGAAGRDTRGLNRLHQFMKVELVHFCAPEDSPAQHAKLLGHAEAILKGLGLKYRVLELCRGDMSFAAAKCYDLEAWAPGQQRWLEVSSVSNFHDFQARRAKIRWRNADGKVAPLHTLNGSGLATPRTIVAILEQYQNADGSVTIPDVLRPYMGGAETL
jgi:seryl-tRNA synthetase